MIVYDKLFKRLDERGITSYLIRKNKIMGESTLQKLRKNEPVTTATLNRLCELLDCQPGDLMEYVPDAD